MKPILHPKDGQAGIFKRVWGPPNFKAPGVMAVPVFGKRV